MKRVFLDNLKGLGFKDAKKMVKGHGYGFMEMNDGGAISAIARPDTIILWLDDNDIVTIATAGDPTQLI